MFQDSYVDEAEYLEPDMTLSESLNNYIATGEGGLLPLVTGIILESTGLNLEEANNLEDFVQGQGDSVQAYATERKLLSMEITSWELRQAVNIVCNYIDSHL